MPEWHSKLAASAASRWMNCPGSIAQSEGVPPSPTSVYAEEGTAAAYLAALCLNNECDADDYLDHWITVNGWDCRIAHKKPKTNHFTVDFEMVESVQLFLDTVRYEDGVIQAEKKVKLPHVHEVLGGTLDAVIADSFGKLIIVDFKYGRGIVVEAVENYQLLIYLLGAERLDVYTEFEVVIVQPRAPHVEGPVRRWTVSRKRLREFAKEAKKKAIEALGKDAKLKAGDHCRWCPVSGQCPEQLRYSQKLTALEFDPIRESALGAENVRDPALLSTKRLADIYRYKKFMADWFSDIGTILRERINLGDDVPGWKLIAGKGNRQWSDEEKAVKFLKRRGFTQQDMYDEPKLKGPAAVEKIKKGKFKTQKERVEFVTSLTNRPEREASLVRDTDKRQSLIPAHAEFEDVTDYQGDQ